MQFLWHLSQNFFDPWRISDLLPHNHGLTSRGVRKSLLILSSIVSQRFFVPHRVYPIIDRHIRLDHDSEHVDPHEEEEEHREEHQAEQVEAGQSLVLTHHLKKKINYVFLSMYLKENVVAIFLIKTCLCLGSGGRVYPGAGRRRLGDDEVGRPLLQRVYLEPEEDDRVLEERPEHEEYASDYPGLRENKMQERMLFSSLLVQ